MFWVDPTSGFGERVHLTPGNIRLNLQDFLAQGLDISTSSTLGEGASAGQITVEGLGGPGSPATSVSLDNGTISTQIVGGNAATPPGVIALTSDSSTISTRSASMDHDNAGIASDITLVSSTDLTLRSSTVSTSAAQESGGNVKLTAPNLIHLVDSTLISSVKGPAGSNGGNINLDPQFVVIQNSQLLANANTGAGGNITIAASGAVLIDPNSLLSASAGPAGVSGSGNISAPIQVLGGILVPLSQSFSQAGLSGDRCAADPTGQFSSFVQIGRDGVPQVPGALSPSPLAFLETLMPESLGSPSPNWAATRLRLDSVRVDDSTRFWFHSACRS